MIKFNDKINLKKSIYYTDRNMALIVMEYLHPHIVLRKGLVKGIRYPLAASAIAKFMANTLFNTSVLAGSAAEHKQRIALFAPNTALCKITEDLVFTDPYRVASLNRWTRPFLDAIKAQFENDVPLKLAVQHKKWQFLTQAEALIHGDLHAGSSMVTQTDTRIIDPEFAFVGPMAFDVGAVIGNFLLAYFAHRGQLTRSVDGDYPNWLLSQIEAIWQQFEDRFVACWKSQQAGDVYAQDLFDATSAQHLFEQQRKSFMLNLFQESLQFAGCKMIRRILGLAHIEDMESIVDPQIRARCETLALHFGRELVLHGKTYTTIQEVTAAASASLTPRELSP